MILMTNEMPFKVHKYMSGYKVNFYIIRIWFIHHVYFTFIFEIIITSNEYSPGTQGNCDAKHDLGSCTKPRKHTVQ